MNKIILWCKKQNLPYTVENCGYGLQCIRIDSGDVYSYSSITSQLYRKRGWRIDGNIYAGTIRVYNQADYEYLQTQNGNVNELVNLFYLTLREGKTSQEAKSAQYQYAINNDMLTAYNAIYNGR